MHHRLQRQNRKFDLPGLHSPAGFAVPSTHDICTLLFRLAIPQAVTPWHEQTQVVGTGSGLRSFSGLGFPGRGPYLRCLPLTVCSLISRFTYMVIYTETFCSCTCRNTSHRLLDGLILQ